MKAIATVAVTHPQVVTPGGIFVSAVVSVTVGRSGILDRPGALIYEFRYDDPNDPPLKPPRWSFLRAVPVQIQCPNPHAVERARDLADAKDVPIPAAAIGAGARILVTHNIRHVRSGEGVRVVRPGTLIEEARAWMSQVAPL